MCVCACVSLCSSHRLFMCDVCVCVCGGDYTGMGLGAVADMGVCVCVRCWPGQTLLRRRSAGQTNVGWIPAASGFLAERTCARTDENRSRIKTAPELKHAVVVIWDQLTKLKSNYLHH